MNCYDGMANNYKLKTEKTYWVRLFIAGDINQIRQVCREYCMDIGLCVTVKQINFIYTGGEEVGAEIGFINYPRFPKVQPKIWEQARVLVYLLMERCCQTSALLMDETKTHWFTRRKEDNKNG